MAKHILPTYTICNLSDDQHSPNDLIADHFDHYLEEHKHLHFPHKHSFYHLVYFTKGKGTHSIDFINFPVEPGQIYFMIPGQVHTWDFKNRPNGFIINFSADYIHALITDPRYLDQFPFFSGIANEQVISIPKEGQQPLIKLFETIISEHHSNNELKDDFARTALIQLFILVNRCIAKPHGKKKDIYNSLLLKNFKKLIDLHYKEKKLTKDYATMLYVTPNHLNALTKDATGRSAGELIRDRVLLEAKRLLVNAQITIAEIATELNFADNSYFSKFFKKYVGVTPEIFRKQIIKK